MCLQLSRPRVSWCCFSSSNTTTSCCGVSSVTVSSVSPSSSSWLHSSLASIHFIKRNRGSHERDTVSGSFVAPGVWTNVGRVYDVCEQLDQSHLERSHCVRALIASDRLHDYGCFFTQAKGACDCHRLLCTGGHPELFAQETPEQYNLSAHAKVGDVMDWFLALLSDAIYALPSELQRPVLIAVIGILMLIAIAINIWVVYKVGRWFVNFLRKGYIIDDSKSFR